MEIISNEFQNQERTIRTKGRCYPMSCSTMGDFKILMSVEGVFRSDCTREILVRLDFENKRNFYMKEGLRLLLKPYRDCVLTLLCKECGERKYSYQHYLFAFPEEEVKKGLDASGVGSNAIRVETENGYFDASSTDMTYLPLDILQGAQAVIKEFQKSVSDIYEGF